MRAETGRLASSRCNLLAGLRAVLTAAALAALDAERVERAADNVIPHAWQVADAAAADEHDAVFLKVVFFARNVGGHFLAVAQAHARDLAQGRVRLLRGHRLDLEAHAALLRAGFEVLDLVDPRQAAARLLDQLIDRRHRVPSGTFGPGTGIPRPSNSG